jgi:hypothetical protein
LKKLQQFYILKFSSDRLKKKNYNIDISFDNARINNEVITINNSELIRTLFRYKDINFDQNELSELLFLQKKLKKSRNNEENRKNLLKTIEKIEKMLFIEDLVSVEFKNKLHYREIVEKNGFYINGTKFTPFMASAGMVRKNTALFINNNIKHQLMDILENDRDENVPLVTAKFGAYFSLYSSSTLPVSFPRFAVVPDKTMKSMRQVDFVTYQEEGKDDKVEEVNYEMETNMWDGQGLITPYLAEKWSQELELDYIFSCAIIRAPFTKGLIVVFDLLKFANEIANTFKFTDIYGEEQDIRNVDLILSESMFKLHTAYENTQDYINKCHKNNLGFSIAKVNLKKEKSHSRTSYQFLQILNLSDGDIARLCSHTIDWFRDISGDNPEKMLLYATGEREIHPENFDKEDISVKAILLNPNLSKDKYIRNRFVKTINKKKRQSYMGSLLINANYQFMVSDPYFQACHIFGIKKKPLLREKEYYSRYWLDKGIKTVGAIRSPIVHHSEFSVLNLKDKKNIRKWYEHIHSGIIFPANGIGIDCAIHGGADFDGDLICTINSRTMLKGRVSGLPIVYESKKAEKTIVNSRDDKEQVECQLKGHNCKVGFATNISSSIYTMLEEFPMGSDEWETLFNRLKIGRVIQGEIIDSVKGLEVPPFREHWTKYKKITLNMTAEEMLRWDFNNKILCNVRPAFFRFLYPHYMTKYNKELKRYNIYSHLVFKRSFLEILRSGNRMPEEDTLIKEYKRHSYFLDNNSIVNRISRYMRINIALINRYSRKISGEFDHNILMNKEHSIKESNLKKMKELLQEYKAFKKNLRNNLKTSYPNLEAFIHYLRKRAILNISTNDSELANYAIEVTYNDEKNMVEFAWRMFPNGILENILHTSTGKINIPVPDEEGKIEYLWNKYTIKQYPLEEIYAN